jgi:hypothetical protein
MLTLPIHFTGCGYYYTSRDYPRIQVSKAYKTIGHLRRYGKIYESVIYFAERAEREQNISNNLITHE